MLKGSGQVLARPLDDVRSPAALGVQAAIGQASGFMSKRPSQLRRAFDLTRLAFGRCRCSFAIKFCNASDGGRAAL